MKFDKLDVKYWIAFAGKVLFLKFKFKAPFLGASSLTIESAYYPCVLKPAYVSPAYLLKPAIIAVLAIVS